MIEEKNKKSKLRVILCSLVFSVILIIFPVTSSVIVVMNGMDAIQSYWMQGVFMMLSIAMPVVFMLITNIKPSQIGFKRVEKGSIKTVLYFVPIIASKIGFLIFGVDSDTQSIIALAFFTIMIGLSEELYFRGIILRKLRSCFTIKQTVIFSSVFFAAVHASQTFSGTGITIVTLTIINALIFGVVASEIVLLTSSIIPVIIWHVLYDFINWISVAKGITEVILIILQSVIMVLYAYYLWTKLSERQACPG